jgi:hypothetical protein
MPHPHLTLACRAARCHARPGLAKPYPRLSSPCLAGPLLAMPRQAASAAHLAAPGLALPRRALPSPIRTSARPAMPRLARPCRARPCRVRTSPRLAMPCRAIPRHARPGPHLSSPRPASPGPATPRQAAPCPHLSSPGHALPRLAPPSHIRSSAHPAAPRQALPCRAKPHRGLSAPGQAAERGTWRRPGSHGRPLRLPRRRQLAAAGQLDQCGTQPCSSSVLLPNSGGPGMGRPRRVRPSTSMSVMLPRPVWSRSSQLSRGTSSTGQSWSEMSVMNRMRAPQLRQLVGALSSPLTPCGPPSLSGRKTVAGGAICPALAYKCPRKCC